MELQDVRTYAELVSKGSNLEETQLWHHLEVVLERIVASQRGPIMVGPPRYGVGGCACVYVFVCMQQANNTDLKK